LNQFLPRDQIGGPSWEYRMPVRFDYRRIMDDIQRRIATGEFPVDQRLPTARDLAVQYGVSEGTVRKAIDLLKDRGVLIGHQGVGVFPAATGDGPENQRGTQTG
jgi:GntR family transcriptional regulator